MSFRVTESNLLFHQIQSQIDELVKGLKRLYSVNQVSVAARQETPTSEEPLREAFSTLVACDESTAVSRAISAVTETVKLMATGFERIGCWPQWKNAQQTLAHKRDQRTKMDDPNQKSEHLEAEIAKNVRNVDQLDKKLIDLSTVILKDLGKFDTERMPDMMQFLIEYIENTSRTSAELQDVPGKC
ncbi:hypothetical protein CAEBREN_05230 [Caenorhabditis brenneri]|uniref:Sorting nexin/Vps5-like C-terminal domain-containing protein n=1 Tax=Caenorhabditis brenneri TaxID=135651 RepID=G0P2U1_CAEBE|nr:hypothetical protein CAEBREN_05230 [Caenorhabditis brenneri]